MRITEPSQLGPLMRLARNRAGLTLHEAASRVGIDYKTVWNLENGTHKTAAELVVKLIVAYGGRLDLTLPGETGGGQDG